MKIELKKRGWKSKKDKLAEGDNQNPNKKSSKKERDYVEDALKSETGEKLTR